MTTEPRAGPETRRNGPPRDSEQGRACEARKCYWNVGMEKWDSHTPGCQFNPRRERLAAAPKSRRRGRITDHESARKELLSMAHTAKGDHRLNPCAAFVYGMLNARGFEHGSVFVAASPDRLSVLSGYDPEAGTGFSPKQCERALDRLRLLGYIEKAKWSRVRKGDPGLYRWAQRLGRPGRWPNAYLLKQDIPESTDRIPDEENPILEMFGLVPA